ncbi:PadR family transcriptional regulator [Kaistia algarum]|uniref:PadR family transcriptional regulator n=1 Tax=Kaistia algarum TaxID=2083279 RepID=UPI001402F02A|nr:PadR family transcriptional regulator [Kaistia algarum]MCX5516125.1 PadR family transcriptional regulator [Kaistia algarum]
MGHHHNEHHRHEHRCREQRRHEDRGRDHDGQPHGVARFFELMGRRGGPGFGPFGHGPRGGRGGDDGFRMGRMVADGDLRLIVLSLIEKQPRHGYDIIKAIEELTSGSYSPSPGVVYPTLTFLEEAGHATAASEGNKKVYSITEAGKAHLDANRAGVDAVLDHLARIGSRMAQAKAWFGRGEDEPRGERPDRDIPGVVPELNDARRALKSAIASRIGESPEEQRRVAAILLKAAEAIGKKPDPAVDL